MSDIIRLLPDSVANQIAAGEVIQRPSSVIKELVENAVDAGATRIDVLVEDAGKTCVRVIDNGKGMSPTDARMAFERHATSKIRTADDLFTLHTMGFRGEALPSIAAVAQVELRTCQEEGGVGTLLEISGSKVGRQESVACAKGSDFSVKNLFFNVPARRKFLKSNQTELSNILTEFERVALVNPGVAFSLSQGGTEMLNLPATGLRQRIMGVFGKKVNQDLLSFDVKTTMVHLSGFIGKPEAARKKGARQFFFVNGRFMRHPYFHKAVTEAYENLVPMGEQVSYFIYFETDPASIDVNIHPTKTEIKFENEQALWQILSAAVKETLGRFNEVPSIDFDTEGMPDIPACDSHPEYVVPQPPKLSFDTSYNPFEVESTRSSWPLDTGKKRKDWGPLFEGLGNEGQTGAAPEEELFGTVSELSPDYERGGHDSCSGRKEAKVSGIPLHHYQYKGRFILTSVKSGLMIIDQRRAHVRILYDRYMSQIQDHGNASQRMLFPDMVHFSPAEIITLQNIADDLGYLGFELGDLGNGTYAINGIPAGIEGLNPERLLTDLVHAAMEKEGKVKEEVQGTLALALAKAAAIVSGQVLSDEEMDNLVDGLFSVSTPNYTPDGKKVVAVLKEEEIERMFK